MAIDELTIGKAEYAARWRPIHDRVFSERAIDEDPFRAIGWTRVLLSGGLQLLDEDLSALARVALEAGDDGVVVVDGEGAFPDEPPLLVPWSRDALEDVRCNTVYGHVVAHAFGHSGEWGMAFSPEDFAVLGAASSFMNQFVSLAGGMDAVRGRFRQNAGDIGFGSEGELYVTGLLAMVGWE